ncbi:MAG: hypothetical protein HY888_00945 [Deltaproteobacteria bacterium]|nr:hypothetical protein [Deltaproteobacteria bacterium]
MDEDVRRKKLEDLLALRGKVAIDYDWVREENAELKATENEDIIDSHFEAVPGLTVVKNPL